MRSPCTTCGHKWWDHTTDRGCSRCGCDDYTPWPPATYVADRPTPAAPCRTCGHGELDHGLTGCWADCGCEAYLPIVAVVLPYDRGTSSGHSGSTTSHERATRRDADGSTATVQAVVLTRADAAGTVGVTVAELRNDADLGHHGSVSGALSNLHSAGRLARLTERRGRCEVYVTPEHVAGRPTVPHGRRSAGTPAAYTGVAVRRIAGRLSGMPALTGEERNAAARIAVADAPPAWDDVVAVFTALERFAGRLS